MRYRERRPIRTLDFDIENRPLSYWYADACTAEVTAIAASFGPDEPVYCWLLGRDVPEQMLEGFRFLYDQADIVTGHYIRKHDLPIINGAMLEYNLAPLGPKLSSDTKLDLNRIADLSASQESLADMLGIEEEKYHMTQRKWRRANRLLDIEEAEKRAVGDVRQHQALRSALVEHGYLGPPKVWRPAR